MEGILALSIPILTIVLVTSIILLRSYLRFRERKILIESNVDPEVIKAIYSQEIKRKNPFGYLKVGIILVCLGIGFGLGELLSDVTGYSSLFILILLSSIGAGYIIVYYLDLKYKEEKNKDKVTDVN
ncbi:MAG TPA: hypothetical protein PK887_06460 [Ignavibacteriales bacterium]|nr:hypothetical protein [Ignavibacteriales bacterium]